MSSQPFICVTQRKNNLSSATIALLGIALVLSQVPLGPSVMVPIGSALVALSIFSWIINSAVPAPSLKQSVTLLAIGLALTAAGIIAGRLEGDGTWIFAPSLIMFPGIGLLLNYSAVLAVGLLLRRSRRRHRP